MIASLFVRLPSAWLALPSGLVWVLAAFQGPEVSGETKGLIGVGIGVSAALLFLLQRAFTQAGVTGELRGELRGVGDRVNLNAQAIGQLQRDAADIEERITKSRHAAVADITNRVAEIQLALTTRLERLETIVERAVGDPAESPAGRAIRAEIEQLAGRITELERKGRR